MQPMKIFTDEVVRQWRLNLGIEVNLEVMETATSTDTDVTDIISSMNNTIVFFGWVTDYPDPDNFLRQSAIALILPK